MTWILILVIGKLSWSSQPVATAEFSSKERCEAAGKALSDVATLRWVCVQK